MSELCLECIDVSKKFRLYERDTSLKSRFANSIERHTDLLEWYVLRDINFRILQGDRVGIIGRNGSGKSTLLKLLTGIYTPTVGGIEIYCKRMLALIELGVGFYDELTARENIKLNWVFNGLPKKELGEYFDEIVEFAGLHNFLDTPLKYYSTGMVARLGFAIASHAHPDLLIVDEVLAVGDAEFQERCYQKIDELCRQGATLILVSHSTSAIEQMCERAILLDGETIAHDGSVLDTMNVYNDALSKPIFENLSVSPSNSVG